MLLLSSVVSAVEVETDRAAALLDSSQTTVAEQTQQALAAVISKKSGWTLRQIMDKGVIDSTFNQAVLRNYYQTPPVGFTDNDIWFSVVVDEAKLKSLMIERQIPVWPNNRGKIFVWMVEEPENGELVHVNQQSKAHYWFSSWLDNKGIPAEYYNFENDDLLSFQPDDVRFLNPDLIDFVQQNHDVSAVLLVFLKHSGSGYSYRYGLTKTGEQTQIMNMKFINLSSGLETLASEVQSAMSKEQQVFADEFKQSTVSVKVAHMSSPDQMLKLLNYLDNHVLVDDYHVNQYKEGQVDLTMNINVLPDTFVRFVDKEKVLAHLPLDFTHSILFSMAE